MPSLPWEMLPAFTWSRSEPCRPYTGAWSAVFHHCQQQFCVFFRGVPLENKPAVRFPALRALFLDTLSPYSFVFQTHHTGAVLWCLNFDLNPSYIFYLSYFCFFTLPSYFWVNCIFHSAPIISLFLIILEAI